MLILSCLFLAATIYIIIVSGLDSVGAFYTIAGLISIVLWSVYTNIGLKLLRELKNKPCDECRIIDVSPLREHLKNKLGLFLENEDLLEIIKISNKIQKEE